MSFKEIWNWLKDMHAEYDWVMEVFLVVLAVVVINFALRLLLRFLQKRVEASENLWDDAIFEAIKTPLRVLVWILGLAIAAELTPFDEEISGFIDPARMAGVIIMLVWFLMRLVEEVKTNIILARERLGAPLDRTTVDAIAKLLRLSIIITGGLVLLQSLGFSIGGVLAFGGVGGLAVGLAAKDMLANFFGGLTIYLDRPFSVGDWVRSPDKEIEGVVEEIGWRRTSIRRFDKRPIYVSNAVFTNITVENPSRMTHRRINETIALRYDDMAKVPAILQEVKQMIENHEEIDSDMIILVNFNQFGAHSLDFFIYCLTVTTDWAKYHAVKEDILLKISDIVEKHGAEMAFPTQTLHVPEAIEIQHAGG